MGCGTSAPVAALSSAESILPPEHKPHSKPAHSDQRPLLTLPLSDAEQPDLSLQAHPRPPTPQAASPRPASTPVPPLNKSSSMPSPDITPHVSAAAAAASSVSTLQSPAIKSGQTPSATSSARSSASSSGSASSSFSAPSHAASPLPSSSLSAPSQQSAQQQQHSPFLPPLRGKQPCDVNAAHLAVVYCADCDEQFCGECDAQVHSRKKTREHTRIAIHLKRITSSSNNNSHSSSAKPTLAAAGGAAPTTAASLSPAQPHVSLNSPPGMRRQLSGSVSMVAGTSRLTPNQSARSSLALNTNNTPTTTLPLHSALASPSTPTNTNNNTTNAHTLSPDSPGHLARPTTPRHLGSSSSSQALSSPTRPSLTSAHVTTASAPAPASHLSLSLAPQPQHTRTSSRLALGQNSLDSSASSAHLIHSIPLKELQNLSMSYLNAVWNEYDTDRNGTLDKEEMRKLAIDCIARTIAMCEAEMKKQNPHMNSKQLQRAVANECKFVLPGGKASADGDAQQKEMVKMLIKKLDVNGDGSITKNELFMQWNAFSAELFQMKSDSPMECSIM